MAAGGGGEGSAWRAGSRIGEKPGESLAAGSFAGEEKQKAGSNFQARPLHPPLFSLFPNSPNLIVSLGSNLPLSVIQLVFHSYLFFLGHINKLCDS